MSNSQLPKFTPKPRCPKCGQPPYSTIWDLKSDILEYICSCTYAWITKTKDAK